MQRKSKNITMLIILLLVGVTSLQASLLGGYAGASLRIPADAISAGTGGITLFHEASQLSMAHNAAAMIGLQGRQFHANMANLPLDRFIYAVNASIPLPPTARLGIGVIAAGTRNIDFRDSRGYYGGDMSDTESIYLAAFSNQLSPRLAVGLSLKMLNRRLQADQNDLDLKGTGFGVNFALQFQAVEKTRLVVALRDWNSSYNWKTQELFEHGANYRESFPMSLAWGLLQDIGRLQLMLEHDNYFIGENVARLALTWNGFGPLVLRSGVEVTPDDLVSGASASYRLNWNGPPMMVDLGLVMGIPGEGVRTYLGWGLEF